MMMVTGVRDHQQYAARAPPNRQCQVMRAGKCLKSINKTKQQLLTVKSAPAATSSAWRSLGLPVRPAADAAAGRAPSVLCKVALIHWLHLFLSKQCFVDPSLVTAVMMTRRAADQGQATLAEQSKAARRCHTLVSKCSCLQKAHHAKIQVFNAGHDEDKLVIQNVTWNMACPGQQASGPTTKQSTVQQQSQLTRRTSRNSS